MCAYLPYKNLILAYIYIFSFSTAAPEVSVYLADSSADIIEGVPFENRL